MKYKLVRVEWLDAKATSHWTSLADVKSFEPVEIVAVGYLLEKTKKKVTVAGCMSELGNVSDICVIPGNWVKKIQYIKGQSYEFKGS